MSLFSRNKISFKIIDTVYVSAIAKWKACANTAAKNATTVFIAWFPETLQQLEAYFSAHSTIKPTTLLYRNANSFNTKDKNIIFVEHYPLPKKETDLFVSLTLAAAHVYSSLDEPLFMHFGGEKMIELLSKLGMKEDEPLENTMITKALHNAQEKIAAKVTLEQSATAQAEWFRKNLPGSTH
ncbi:MAG TPA: hypothetical protein PKM63_03535 [Panacibacter sp.]|nr:hypothetical protein [Panacibacter sp.]HNP43330.1 hypothetical protein [Panacibacter sp.]